MYSNKKFLIKKHLFKRKSADLSSVSDQRWLCMRWKPGLRRTGWRSYSKKPGSRSGEESLEEEASTLDAVLAPFLGQALTQIPWILTPSVPKLQSPLRPLLGSFNGVRMGLPTWLSGEESTCQGRRHGFDPRVWKIPWRRKCNPLQYSCLGNPMDRGAWRATHGVAESDTIEATEQARMQWGQHRRETTAERSPKMPPHYHCSLATKNIFPKGYKEWQCPPKNSHLPLI